MVVPKSWLGVSNHFDLIALGWLESPSFGNEDGLMPKDTNPGKPATRRCTAEEKGAAVRMVRTLRAELGTDHGTVKRVAA